ncbi:hypothetical protein NC653_012441 [Populus alba x Populus x berolinensis]|uniref:Uncharacterized protein n=1 Tax=Populus alba x Populus x berolinensis TaxID=444605 RepID=A0AAD6R4W1_9ROSI|nr:hypothetical protein NC653_012441 [Populus alba x Populus x berolinensis]
MGLQVNVDSEIEYASPGLIIRKRKGAVGPGANDNEAPETFDIIICRSRALGIRCCCTVIETLKEGYHAEDEEGNHQSQEISGTNQRGKEKKRADKSAWAQRTPSFLNSKPDIEILGAT